MTTVPLQLGPITKDCPSCGTGWHSQDGGSTWQHSQLGRPIISCVSQLVCHSCRCGVALIWPRGPQPKPGPVEPTAHRQHVSQAQQVQVKCPHTPKKSNALNMTASCAHPHRPMPHEGKSDIITATGSAGCRCRQEKPSHRRHSEGPQELTWQDPQRPGITYMPQQHSHRFMQVQTPTCNT